MIRIFFKQLIGMMTSSLELTTSCFTVYREKRFYSFAQVFLISFRGIRYILIFEDYFVK